MIDIEKEREAFIKVYTEIYGEHDQLWQGWKARAELAQAEINKEREHYVEYRIDTAHLEDEINELKQKLARYENPDYVLVPRIPTDEMLVGARDWSYKKYGKPVGNDGANGCYKAMIKAVEKNNG